MYFLLLGLLALGTSDHTCICLTSAVCELLFNDVGPAGTGKTESVKALGNQLGRFVLVFNCDETFDFQVSVMHYVDQKYNFQ